MLRSIRWRLAASYMLLTLFVITLLGAATLWLVRVSVERQEIDFLTANANSVARQALPLLGAPPSPDGVPVALAPQPMLHQLARMAAFLGNVQVKIFDAQHNLIIDSGDPANLNELAWYFTPVLEGVVGAYSSPIMASPSAGQPLERGSAPPSFALNDSLLLFEFPLAAERAAALRWQVNQTSTLNLEGRHLHVEGSALPGLGPEGDADVMIIRTFPSQWGSRFVFEERGRAIYGSMAAASALTQSTELKPFVPITRTAALSDAEAGAAQPVAQAADALATTPRSPRTVQMPIGLAENPVGYVELSNGPDFGSPLLDTIFNAFLLAAGGVSVLAVLLGLLVGQGLTAPLLDLTATAAQMSRGDLAMRARVRGQDEIGALARQFNQMAAQIESSFAELAAERDALRRFIADASHELRTPITALQTFLDLLRGAAVADPQAQSEFLDESQRQVGRLARVTASLLDLSRLDAGLSDLQLQRQEVGELLQGAAALFKMTAQEKGIDFVVTVPVQPLAMLCDRERMESALINLLDNAFKFVQAGGRVEIGAELQQTENQLRLWVADNGPGVPEADAPYIFERFYKGKSPTAAEQGAGLGLAIVQSIVRAHGGQLFLESPNGQGSRFVIELSNHI